MARHTRTNQNEMSTMTNPFEALADRIDRVEMMVSKVLEALDRLPAGNEVEAHDRRTPATRQTAAEYLGVSMGTIDNLVRSKQLKSCKVGRAIRFRWEALDEFINKRNK